MKTYRRRIAFMLGDQHLIPHGGVGQFAKAFVEMANEVGWKVDIITDKRLRHSEFAELLEAKGASICYPVIPLSYRDHSNTFAFSDSVNFEKIINFRSSLMTAFETNIYDMIVCNTPEAFPAAYALNIQSYVPIVFYTHNESMIFRDTRTLKNVFSESFNEYFNQLMSVPNIVVGTQSARNALELGKYVAHPEHLQMPITESALLEPNHLRPRHGVLFIGRWEKGKNPDEYLRVIKETGYPAKILTNSNGAKKFEAWFKDNYITDYDIGVSLIGQAKVDFIAGSRLLFHTSLRESYSYAMYECIGHMPCVVLEKAEWPDNFDSRFFTRVTKANAAETISRLYDTLPDTDRWYAQGSLQYVCGLHRLAKEQWVSLVETFTGKVSASSSAKINTVENISHRTYIRSLHRSVISIEDVQSILANRNGFTVRYTDTDTYYLIGDAEIPVSGSGSLEGLLS